MKGLVAGSVVMAYMPFQEIPSTKLRPVVIIENCGNEYFVCQITSKDRSGTNKGFWVPKDSPEGKQMGVILDSFVNAENTAYIKPHMVERQIGAFARIDELVNLTQGQ